MDDIQGQGRIAPIGSERTAVSHKVDEKNPQGERPGYRPGHQGKPPEAPDSPGEETEAERHLIDIIV